MQYQFDINGNLAAIIDSRGNQITFEYEKDSYGNDLLLPLYGPSEFFIEPQFGGPSDGRGLIAMDYKLKTITDDLGRKINFNYNDQGLLTDINDFAGRSWHYTYDSASNDLLMATNPAGYHVNYEYDQPGQNGSSHKHKLTSITDARGQEVTKNYYNSEGKAYKQVIGGNSEFQFAYDPATNSATVIDPEGIITKMVYNGIGYLANKTIYTKNPNDEPNSFTYQYAYDSKGLKTRDTFPKGNCVDYTYDNLGNVTGVYRKTSPSEPNDAEDPNVIGTEYTYDANFVHKIKTITDAMGNVTTFDYNNTTGLLEKAIYPTVSTPQGDIAPTQLYTYNTYGQIDTSTGQDGIVTKFVYYGTNPSDPNYGRLWKVIEDYNTGGGLNLTTEYKYDILGRIYEIKDPNGNTTKLEYNSLNQLAKITSPSPFNYATVFSYDENGNKTRIEREKTDANQIVRFSYNILNKIQTLTNPLDYNTVFGYNRNGEPNIVTDAELNSTKQQYNERGLVTKVTDANGGQTNYSYTLNGQLAQIADANGNITKYDYDGFDRLKCVTYPDETNEVFGYDKNGNLTSKKNRGGQTISYTYDALNRVNTKTIQGESTFTYVYDIVGRILDVNENTTRVADYSYDRIGRLEETIDSENRNVSYEYDKLGRRTKLIYPDDTNVAYEYDAASRLTKVKYQGSTIAEYSYDELSRRTLLTYGNDANIVYQYDLADRLTRITNNANPSIDINYSDYDKVGNRKNMIVDNNTYSYTYDKLYQLTSVDYPTGAGTDANYYYDALGNRTQVVAGSTTNYLHNTLNQYDSVASVAYSYDAKGNLANDGEYKYYYDCENRLTDMNTVGNIIVISCGYDWAGRLVSKYNFRLQTTIKYVYDGDQVIAEYDSSGNLLRKFIYGPKIDEPIVILNISGGNETEYYYHYDGLGSVIALSNNNGSIVEGYIYNAFGTPAIRTGPGADGKWLTGDDTGGYWPSPIGNPYCFTAREWDYTAELYYYRARYYKPSIGRFLQPDPIGYGDGINMYVYVKNNSVNYTDPSGKITPHEIACGICAAMFLKEIGFLLYDCIKEARGSKCDKWDAFGDCLKDHWKDVLIPESKLEEMIRDVSCFICLKPILFPIKGPIWGPKPSPIPVSP